MLLLFLSTWETDPFIKSIVFCSTFLLGNTVLRALPITGPNIAFWSAFYKKVSIPIIIPIDTPIPIGCALSQIPLYLYTKHKIRRAERRARWSNGEFLTSNLSLFIHVVKSNNSNYYMINKE
jgi:hypothetical protein